MSISYTAHLSHTCRYWVFRSWGRVGTTIGGNKLDKFHDKNSALDNFLGVYKEKTGNDWGSSNFTKYPNKFYPLEIDYGQVRTNTRKTIKEISSNMFSLSDWICFFSAVLRAS